jgi:adenylosuccinate lyase
MIERYTTPEMRRIWSDTHKYETWLQVEIAVCEVLAKLGRIPADSLKKIKAKASFDPDRILEIESTTRHDVIAFLTNVAEHVGPDSRFIHVGMTSSDLLDTSLAILCVEAGRQISKRLTSLHKLLRKKARDYIYTWQIGRTHGIHAEPITFGLKLALWSEEMARNLGRWESALDDIAVGKISGVVGTYAHLEPEVEKQICEQLNLKPASISNQIVQRDRHASFLSAMAIIGATLEKIAVEIRHLQRTEVQEVEEPFKKGQKGSSAMPHKRNPIIAERISGMARLLRSNSMVGLENVALWHERDISHSSVERIILPDSTTILDYMLQKMYALIDGMMVYPERMMANIQLTGGLIFSQPVLLALVEKGATREQAYAIVQRHAMAVWEKKESDFYQLLKSDKEVIAHLSEKELENCFNFDQLQAKVDAIFTRLGL